MNLNIEKIRLCLGAGGARGLSYIGFLEVLEEHNLKIDQIYGCSMGAIIGASYSSGYPLSDMKCFFGSVNSKSFIRLSFIRNGIFSTYKFHNLLKQIIKCDKFEDLNIKLTVSCTNLQTGEAEYFHSGKLILPVLASSSAAGLFSPTEIGGNYYVDGGYSDPIPIPEDIDEKYPLVVIDPSVNPKWELNLKPPIYKIFNTGNVFKQAVKSIDILMHNYIESKYDKDKYIWLKPDLPLDLSFSDFEKSKDTIKAGRYLAEHFIRDYISNK